MPEGAHPTLLADYYYDHSSEGDLGAGDKWEQTTSLESNQVAEITHVEVFSPISSGTAGDLRRLTLIIDGQDLGQYVLINPYYWHNTAPPRAFIYNTVWQFGSGAIAETHPLMNLTLKAKKNFGIKAFAGDSAVTSSFRIRIYGYLYEEEEHLRRIFGDRAYTDPATIVDRNRGVSLDVTKDAIDVSIEHWDEMVGGVRQAKPQVFPLVRFAYNATATTANREYEFSHKANQVATPEENLFFELDENEAVFIQSLGVRSVEHLKYAGIKIGSVKYPGDEGFRVDYPVAHPLHFGHGYPLFPQDLPIFYAVPRLNWGFLIHDEKGRVFVQDDGTSISADNIVVAIQGIYVSL